MTLQYKPLNKAVNKEFYTFTGMFDSGATINCIDAGLARRIYRPYIQTQRGFYVRTASTNIIISQYVEFRILMKDGEYRRARFYLLRNSPHQYIVSRGLFMRVGWTIRDPEGKEYKFVNKSTYENLSPDLYDDIIKHMEYPVLNKMSAEQQEQVRE